jgi:hypothetical protein
VPHATLPLENSTHCRSGPRHNQHTDLDSWCRHAFEYHFLSFSFTTNFMCDLKFKPRNGGLKTLVPFIISLAYIFSFKFIPCYNELKSEHYSHEPGTNRYGPMSYVLLAGPTKIAVSAHGWTGTQKRASRRSGRVPSLPFFLLAPSG